jgi:hypothetical protein
MSASTSSSVGTKADACALICRCHRAFPAIERDRGRAACHDCRVKHLDAEGALRAGGWVPGYARVLAITADDDVAAVLVDSNGDGVDVDLDEYVRQSDGTWQEGLSGCVDEEGVGWSADMVSLWGQAMPGTEVTVRHRALIETILAEPSGWWLFIARLRAEFDPDAPGALPERIR